MLSFLKYTNFSTPIIEYLIITIKITKHILLVKYNLFPEEKGVLTLFRNTRITKIIHS